MSQKHFSVISGGISGRAALLAACLAAAAQATTYSINTTNMGFVNDGNCGLREAIDAINTQTRRWGCPGPDGSSDGIFLQAGTYTAPVGMTLDRSASINCPVGTCIVDAGSINTNFITLSSLGPTVFVNDITLRQSSGNTNNINGLKVLGGTVNLYHTVVTGFKLAGVSIQAGSNHTISHSTFTGNKWGFYLSDGTGIQSDHNTISNNWQGIRAGNVVGFNDDGSVISDNADAGVEIPNGGSLAWINTTISRNRNRGIHMGEPGSLFTLFGCTIDGNTTSGDGAGLYVPGPSSGSNIEVDLKSSTISNNRAQGDGGGVYCTATVLLTNCTISNDTAKRGGGAFASGVSSNAYLSITTSTIAFNRAVDSGGGLYYIGTPLAHDNFIGVAGCIVARNTAGLKYPDMCGAASGVRSLFGDWTGSTGHSEDLTPADPLLGPLMDNAGPIHVKTRALLKGSPAVNRNQRGFSQLIDNRGIPRPTPPDQAISDWDVGAYEVAPFETEVLDLAAASGSVGIFSDATFSNGAGTRIENGTVGNYATYIVAVPHAVSTGTQYTVLLRARALPNGAKIELASAPASPTPQFTTIGTADLYAPAPEYDTYAFFFKFTSVGTKYFRLKIIGKNAKSTGYAADFDNIEITEQ
ncbi:MAG: right-handed parallel beta-helix repeat-containing protein [Fibrobacteres bacterium]|nr:right-handed parallel beta-helix repeat-containing protein [Fibrobacterota bacterium]